MSSSWRDLNHCHAIDVPLPRMVHSRISVEMKRDNTGYADSRDSVIVSRAVPDRIAPYISLRYSWTNCTAMAPSPTADATRFTESERTSPAAKTPG
jgi:hypothetical protein